MKVCIKCNTEKPKSEFYGVQGDCKTCTKERVKKREQELRKNPEWVEKEKERHREKYFKLGYKDKHKPSSEKQLLSMMKHRERYSEKYQARTKSQRMKPLVKGNHLHHWSYNKEHYKDVIELSVLDHNLVHRKTIYDQERMMYRTLNGVLLDTKESAIEYYKSIGVNI